MFYFILYKNGVIKEKPKSLCKCRVPSPLVAEILKSFYGQNFDEKAFIKLHCIKLFQILDLTLSANHYPGYPIIAFNFITQIFAFTEIILADFQSPMGQRQTSFALVGTTLNPISKFAYQDALCKIKGRSSLLQFLMPKNVVNIQSLIHFLWEVKEDCIKAWNVDKTKPPISFLYVTVRAVP